MIGHRRTAAGAVGRAGQRRRLACAGLRRCEPGDDRAIPLSCCCRHCWPWRRSAASGRRCHTAFVAGYELQCRLGLLLAPGHYNVLGFHATGTLGSFGAAAACAHLLGLDAEQFATALGIAGTQAAGLKSMFGTMCKPLHAGKAAYHGLLAARLAARGFTSRTDALECAQGFARTHSPDFNPDRAFGNAAGWLPYPQQSLQVSRRLLHDPCADRGRAQAARAAWAAPRTASRASG